MLENESKNDLENNLKVTMKNTHTSRIVIGIAGFVVLVCGAIVLALELLYPDNEPDYVSASVILVLGIFFVLFFVFYKPFLRKTLQKTMQGKEGVNTYRFTEEGYAISTVLNDGTTGTTQGNYFAVTLCKEFPEFWLIYLNKATYFIVEKSGMKTGTAEELTQFFMNKFNGKYKVCYKKK